ncbi:MAG: PspC protein [Frankiales bacterium]|nr:PspC protein [Frankiales bacterium]
MRPRVSRMTEQMTDQPPMGGNRAGEGRRGSLRRPLTGRYVGGVAAGIARWFGLDPLLVRVAFVVLSLFGGSGFLLYAIAWLIVPEDGAVDGPLRVWLDRGRRPHGLLRLAAYATLGVVGLATVLFGYDVLFTRSYSRASLPFLGIRWLLDHGLQVGFLVAVTLIALSVLSRDRGETTAASSPGASAPPGPAFATPTFATPTFATPTATAPTVTAPTAATSPGIAQPAAGPTGDAALVQELRRRRLLPSRRRQRSPLGWLVLGIALAVTAVLTGLNAAGATDISGLRIGAVALLLLALGLLVGAFAGWSRWLTLVALALSVGLLPVTLTRAASTGTFVDTVPSSFAQRPYLWLGRATGTEILDLSALQQPHIPQQREAVDDNGIPIPGAKPTTVYDNDGYVTVSMRAGKVILTTPSSGNWSVSARTSFGTVTMPDQAPHRGFNAQSYFSSGDMNSGPVQTSANSAGQTSIQIYMSYGDIEVRRAAS